MQMFGELHAGGATVCLATHDPRWVTQVQRHIYLFDGRMVDRVTAEDADGRATHWSVNRTTSSAAWGIPLAALLLPQILPDSRRRHLAIRTLRPRSGPRSSGRADLAHVVERPVVARET